MKLVLMHGRYDPEEAMDDWGFHGPTLFGVKYVHSVYGNLTVGFKTNAEAEKAQQQTGWPLFDKAVLEIREHDTLIKITPEDGTSNDPAYFGDWELVEDQDPVGGEK